jgi:hypothetical protein
MVSLACATATAGDATLVTLSLSSADPTHVRIANRLDGPVWPPREQGVPAAGWDEEGFEGVVDGTLALGYACPVTTDETAPPAEIVETRPPTDDDAVTARSLVRDLGDASPPPAAVGLPEAAAAPATTDAPETVDTPAADTPESDPTVADSTAADGTDRQDADDAASASPPPVVTAWLDDIESRLDEADRLAAATSVTEAAEAVAAVGGPEEIHALRDQLAADREALSTLAERCDALADEAETAEIPVETLARLA